MLKTYIKHKKHNFVTVPIFNIIMIKHGSKITVYIYYNTVFQ